MLFRWLVYRIFRSEMRELEMWREKHAQYTRWLAEYEDVSIVLKNLGDEVYVGQRLSQCELSDDRPPTVSALLAVLRYKKYRNNPTPIPSSFFEKEQ